MAGQSSVLLYIASWFRYKSWWNGVAWWTVIEDYLNSFKGEQENSDERKLSEKVWVGIVALVFDLEMLTVKSTQAIA